MVDSARSTNIQRRGPLRLHSPSALVAALICAAGPTVVNAGLVTEQIGSAAAEEQIWAAMLVTLFVLPPALTFAAAFSSNAAFRITALSAAFISFLPSLLLIVMIIGVYSLPGVTAILCALVAEVWSSRSILLAIASTLVGMASGVGILITTWLVLISYDDCGSSELLPAGPNGHPDIVRCHETITTSDVSLAAAILLLTLAVMLLPAAMFPGRREPGAAR